MQSSASTMILPLSIVLIISIFIFLSCIYVTWVSRLLDSPANWLFAKQPIRLKTQNMSKFRIYDRRPVDCPHRGPVMQKIFPCYDVTMLNCITLFGSPCTQFPDRNVATGLDTNTFTRILSQPLSHFFEEMPMIFMWNGNTNPYEPVCTRNAFIHHEFVEVIKKPPSKLFPRYCERFYCIKNSSPDYFHIFEVTMSGEHKANIRSRDVIQTTPDDTFLRGQLNPI